jgi:hypothetical protein
MRFCSCYISCRLLLNSKDKIKNDAPSEYSPIGYKEERMRLGGWGTLEARLALFALNAKTSHVFLHLSSTLKLQLFS